ncbi:MAG TPA: MipA/OmpV family protein [Pseudomonas sp.]|uniref:MipA/OmpV family protein n=1 Tax=Pseudomonas sp. TaxID=306 RepID=UPI002ED90655
MSSRAFSEVSFKLVRTLPATLVILAAGGLPMTSAFAQTTDTTAQSSGEGRSETDISDSKWGIGFAGGMNYRVYRDFDDKVRGFPMVTYEGEYVHVFGSGVDVKLPSVGPVTFRLRGKYISEGYESGDSPFLRGMSDRDSSFWVGGVATWRTEWVRLSAEVLTDAMNNSKGSRAKLQIDRRFAAGAFGVTPRLAAEWVDSNYVDYYYGVTADEVIAGRPGYQGASTVNTEAGIRMDWRPALNHSVFVDLGATLMGGGIQDSPLVEKSTQYGAGFGYFYRF